MNENIQIDDALLDVVRLSTPRSRSKIAALTSEIVDASYRYTGERPYSADEIFEGVKELVRREEVERVEEGPSPFRYRYRLTKKGDDALPPKDYAPGELDKKRQTFCHHKGAVTCPKCGGDDTGAKFEKTTWKVMPLYCFDCRRAFRKAASVIGAYDRPEIQSRTNRSTKPQKGGLTMATKKKTELKKMTLKSLIEYFNEITDGTPVKKFPSKDVAIRRVEAAQRAAKKSNARSTGAKKTGSKRKDGPSRYQMIRDTFAKKKKATREELMKLTGWDSNSVHVAMSILKNPTRTKPENQVVTEFDKEKGVYVRA